MTDKSGYSYVHQGQGIKFDNDQMEQYFDTSHDNSQYRTDSNGNDFKLNCKVRCETPNKVEHITESKDIDKNGKDFDNVIKEEHTRNVLGDIEETLSLYPFVCGLCFEKFNNITDFYSHLRSHPEDVEPHLHRCNKQDVAATEVSLQSYVCKKCSVVYPSLCCLHEHLAEVECLSVYKISTKERMAYPCDEEIELENRNADLKIESKDDTLYEKVEAKNIHVKDISLKKGGVAGKRKRNLKRKRTNKRIKITNGFSDVNSKKYTDQNDVKAHDDNDVSVYDDSEETAASEEPIIKTCFNDVKIDIEHHFDDSTKENINTVPGAVEWLDSFVERTDEHTADSKTDVLKKLKRKGNKQNPSIKDEPGLSFHTNNTYLPCETCGVNVLRCKIKRHMMIHSDSRDFPCEVCGCCFKSDIEMKQHKKLVHTSEDYSMCHTCGKSFKNSAYLRQHERTHAERDKKCPHCTQVFCTDAILRRHLVLHRDEKQHRCNQCKKEFTYKTSLTSHMLQVHNDVRAFICQTCGKTFKLRQGLKKHLKTHEPPQYFCHTCGKSFVCAFNLKVHMKLHSRELVNKVKDHS